MKVFLIGYMGSGKSTSGPHLAAALGVAFRDLDREIELREDATVAKIFSDKGEAHFLQAEHELLSAFCGSDESFVMACGGGTPMFHDNMDRMNDSGITVYVKVNEDELVHRLLEDRNNRPLLMGQTDAELQRWIRSHFRLREPRYEECQIVWEESESVDSLIDRLSALR